MTFGVREEEASSGVPSHFLFLFFIEKKVGTERKGVLQNIKELYRSSVCCKPFVNNRLKAHFHTVRTGASETRSPDIII